MEFLLLDGEQASKVDGVPWPADTVVLYGTEAGRMVARSAMMNLTVIEGSFVAEDKRGTSLAFRMLKEMETIFRAANKSHAMAMAADDQPEVAEYLSRVGFERLPVTMYQKKLES